MALNTTPSNRCLHPSVAYSTNHNPATTSAFCQGSKQTYLLHNAENCQSNSYSRLIKFLQSCGWAWHKPDHNILCWLVPPHPLIILLEQSSCPKILHGLRGAVFHFCGRRVIVPASSNSQLTWMYLQIELSYWKLSSGWRYLHSDLPLPCATCVLYSFLNCRSIPLIIMHCWATSIERLLSKNLCPLT